MNDAAITSADLSRTAGLLAEIAQAAITIRELCIDVLMSADDTKRIAEFASAAQTMASHVGWMSDQGLLALKELQYSGDPAFWFLPPDLRQESECASTQRGQEGESSAPSTS